MPNDTNVAQQENDGFFFGKAAVIASLGHPNKMFRFPSPSLS